MEQNHFTDGTTSGYVELPVEAAWLSWTRGDAKQLAARDTDPGLYYGGWRAFVINNQTEEPNPPLPWPVVTRVSEDGQHTYQVYASNVLRILPVQHRTRFERREKVTDEGTGREYERVVEIARERQQGFAPHRQIFGLVFNADLSTFNYGVLNINKWSSFISFERAGQKWNKVKVPDGKALIRGYGSQGEPSKENKAIIIPKFEVVGQGRSTPIEPIGLDAPKFYPITPDLESLYEQSLEWKKCERWNAVGAVAPEETPQQQFAALALAMGMNDAETKQMLAEAGGDYAEAIALMVATDTSTAPEFPDMNQLPPEEE